MPAPLRPESIQCQTEASTRGTNSSIVELQENLQCFEGENKRCNKCIGEMLNFPQNTAATLMAWQFRQKQILTSCLQTVHSVAA